MFVSIQSRDRYKLMKLIEIGINRQQPQGFKAFIPHPFPPQDNLDFPSNILIKNEKATRLIGKLDGVTKQLPDVDFFLLSSIVLKSRRAVLGLSVPASLIAKRSCAGFLRFS